MFHLSPPQLVLLPSWELNVRTKNGHQQGGVIDGADICGYTFQTYLGRSVFCPPSLSSLSVCLPRRLSLSPSPFLSISLALYLSLAENSNPKPLFTSPSASILMYICEERVPALLIRSTAPLKGLRGERWWYLLLSTCPLHPPTVLMINDVNHIRGALSDRDTPTKQSRG